MRPLDRRRDPLAAEVAARERALSGGQQPEARRILGAIREAVPSRGGAMP